MRLQESIRRILKEERSVKSRVKFMIKDVGMKKTIDIIGGIDNLFKLLGINSPMDFLHLFDDLEQVQSKEKEYWILFRYKPNHNFMIYNTKNKEVYINYHDMWSFLEFNFGLNVKKLRELTKEWLDKSYNLRDVTINPGNIRWVD